MEYKNTLNLPKTKFPMKANLNQREPNWIKSWQEKNIYQEILSKRKNAPKYCLHDGPPYANGHIHMGHALNKILKDIVVKYKTIKGFNCAYIPGWDCHGLPVEHQLLKELGKSKENVDQVKFRREAAKYANKYVKIQKEEFIRLGIFGDWNNPYLTMDPLYEADTVETFGKLFLNGFVYKALKPISWCCSCETALAEAEVEYQDHHSPSVFVKFLVKDGDDLFELNDKPHNVIIWTTTPWTLPANLAVAMKPDLEYQLVDALDEYWVVQSDRIADLREKTKMELKVVKSFSGESFEGLKLLHPFVEREVPVIMADFVLTDQGTGCVHIAPGHGQDDFEIGKKYGLDVYSPVNEKGCFVPDAPVFSGEHVRDANPKIVDLLKNGNRLVFSEQVQHSYPHCWRCKTAIIFRSTAQWFLKIDHNALRDNLLSKIKAVNWIPEAGIKRISSMVEGRPDWCLSRQRLWGCPIPVFYCVKCNADLLNDVVLQSVVKHIKSEGAGVWFEKKTEELLPKETVCSYCGHDKFTKELDILDVWFDSGSSHQAVMKRKKELTYPADLYLEGSDQHRGWFQSSMIVGVALNQGAPFKTVLTHGFIVDEKGQKMSKSMGNVISPQEVIQKYGADILRLWVSSVDYSFDVKLSDNNLMQMAEAYKKVRNTFKYLLGNLNGFDPIENMVAYEDLQEIDKYCLSRLYHAGKNIDKYYEDFDFHRVFHGLYNFCVTDLSSFYLDVLKDRLYTFPLNSLEHNSAQTVLWNVVNALTIWFSPLLVFTTEEVWNLLHEDKNTSVHQTEWPVLPECFKDVRLEQVWSKLIEIRDKVNKEIEPLRKNKTIGSSLEVSINLKVKDKTIAELLELKRDILPSLFITSEATFVYDSTLQQEMEVVVTKATGDKCERCWNRAISVGENEQHQTLCAKCVKHIAEIVKVNV